MLITRILLVVVHWLLVQEVVTACELTDNKKKAIVDYAMAYPVELSHFDNSFDKSIAAKKQIKRLSLLLHKLDRELEGVNDLAEAAQAILRSQCPLKLDYVLERLYHRHAIALRLREEFKKSLSYANSKESANKEIKMLLKHQQELVRLSKAFGN